MITLARHVDISKKLAGDFDVDEDLSQLCTEDFKLEFDATHCNDEASKNQNSELVNLMNKFCSIIVFILDKV